MALGMALVAGGVQGVIAHQFDFLVVKVLVGFASALVLIMAGAISARQRLKSAIVLGFLMGIGFFVARWSGWSLMENGINGLAVFLTTPPWSWPAYLNQNDISGFWIVEAISMFFPALIGCYVGQERPEAETVDG